MQNREIDLAVLGCTGSIGAQTLDVARRLGCRVRLLAADSSAEKVGALIDEFKPDIVSMRDESAARTLRSLYGCKVYGGADGINEAISDCAALHGGAVAVDAVTGMAGLRPALTAAGCGMRLAMANKEAIVTAGAHVFAAVRRGGAELIPVDSEHSAVFRCMRGISPDDVDRIILTASGGAFYGRARDALASVTPAEALAHPTWRMGAKITVDSATLMNKGFEIIEAVRLFGVPESRVDVVIHRQSVIHSMVRTLDGAIMAQLGAPDMRACIAYALTYPDCPPPTADRLDFGTMSSLTFASPDTDAFPLLELARYAVRRDGVAPAAMNAANEVAVAAFLAGEIGFNDIADVVAEITTASVQATSPVQTTASEQTTSSVQTTAPSLEAIFDADALARVKARELADKIKRKRS